MCRHCSLSWRRLNTTCKKNHGNEQSRASSMISNIIDYFLSGNYWALWLLLLFLLSVTTIFKKPYIHPRVIKRLYVVLALLLLPIIGFQTAESATGYMATIVVSPFLILAFLTVWYPLPHELFLIARIKKNKRAHPVFPEKIYQLYRYYISTPGKFSFLRMLIQCYPDNDKIRLACYELTHKLNLFVKEKHSIEYNKLMFFFKLGAIKETESLLKKVTKKLEGSAELLMIKSHIARAKLEFERERSLLEEVIHWPNVNTQVKLMAYNGYAGNALVRGNKEEILDAATKAYSLCIKQGLHKHIILPNLIDHYVLLNKEKADKLFKEYRGLIDQNDIDDLIAWNNYRLNYYRQIKNRQKLTEAIGFLESEIIPQANQEDQFSLMSTLLRIKWDDDFDWNNMLPAINEKLPNWLSQPVEKSYFPAKTLFAVVDGRPKTKEPAYELIYKQLESYFFKVRHEIEDWRNELPTQFIHHKCNLSKEKAWLLLFCFDFKTAQPKSFIELFNRRLEIYEDIIDIYDNHYCFFDVLLSRLILTEEIIYQFEIPEMAARLKSKEVWPHSKGWLIKAEDHTNKAYATIVNGQNDPNLLIYKIILAYFFVFFKEYNLAYKLYNDFRQSGISSELLARNYKHYYFALDRFFSK